LRKLGTIEKETELKGTKESIDYMKNLGRSNFNLIKEFSKWVLAMNPDTGLEIFTCDEERTEDEALSKTDTVNFFWKL